MGVFLGGYERPPGRLRCATSLYTFLLHNLIHGSPGLGFSTLRKYMISSMRALHRAA